MASSRSVVVIPSSSVGSCSCLPVVEPPSEGGIDEFRLLEGIDEFLRLVPSPGACSTPLGRKSVWFGRRMSPPPLPSAWKRKHNASEIIT